MSKKSSIIKYSIGVKLFTSIFGSLIDPPIKPEDVINAKIADDTSYIQLDVSEQVDSVNPDVNKKIIQSFLLTRNEVIEQIIRNFDQTVKFEDIISVDFLFNDNPDLPGIIEIVLKPVEESL